MQPKTEKSTQGTHDGSPFGALDGFRVFQHVISSQPKHNGHFHICIPGKYSYKNCTPKSSSCTSRWSLGHWQFINQTLAVENPCESCPYAHCSLLQVVLEWVLGAEKQLLTGYLEH